MNIPVAPLSKSAFSITPSWVSNFSIPMFSYTSLSILKVRLTSLCLPSSFTALSGTFAHAPLCYTFLLLGCATSTSSFFWHPHHFCLSEITPCPLFSFTWHPFCLHLLHSTYDTITSFVYHPNSNRHASSRMPSPQCSCTFHHRTCTRLLLHSFCYTFCGMAICATSSTTCNFFFPFQREHSLHLYPFSPYLKHSTFTVSCFFIILSFISHCITLLDNTSNLFWGAVLFFSFPSLFLQFQARCPNPLQLQHSCSFFSSNFALNMVRICFVWASVIER